MTRSRRWMAVFLCIATISCTAQQTAPAQGIGSHIERLPATQPADELTFLLKSYPNGSKHSMVIIDPKGHRIGHDVLTTRNYRSATNATEELEGEEDLGENRSTATVYSITFRDPASGVYEVLLTSKTSGTFSLYISADCGAIPIVGQVDMENKPLQEGKRQVFRIRFDHAHCDQLVLISPTEQ
ncbi:MAG TPA: hypothetical protein VM578_00370 [Candidatus Saccharimonadales bacterium]|nr:hypothetical protein [Candidatus Saccharimonadales bacterium]